MRTQFNVIFFFRLLEATVVLLTKVGTALLWDECPPLMASPLLHPPQHMIFTAQTLSNTLDLFGKLLEGFPEVLIPENP